jgi:hypothetical protein
MQICDTSLAIGVGEGSEVWVPLGRVVIGGLSVTTLFTLFFIPSLYMSFMSPRTCIFDIVALVTGASRHPAHAA